MRLLICIILYLLFENKGSCGSCWAFSAIAPLEFQNYKATGNLVSLSEQQLIDCSPQGCEGGYTGTAYNYIINNNGIDTTDSYTYVAQVK